MMGAFLKEDYNIVLKCFYEIGYDRLYDLNSPLRKEIKRAFE